MSAEVKVPPGYMLVPSVPSKAMLRGMSAATFLSDGSDMEMLRRWNGAIAALGKSRKHKAVLRSLGVALRSEAAAQAACDQANASDSHARPAGV